MSKPSSIFNRFLRPIIKNVCIVIQIIADVEKRWIHAFSKGHLGGSKCNEPDMNSNSALRFFIPNRYPLETKMTGFKTESKCFKCECLHLKNPTYNDPLHGFSERMTSHKKNLSRVSLRY